MLAERLGPTLANAPSQDLENPTPAEFEGSQLLLESERWHINGMYVSMKLWNFVGAEWHFRDCKICKYLPRELWPVKKLLLWNQLCRRVLLFAFYSAKYTAAAQKTLVLKVRFLFCSMVLLFSIYLCCRMAIKMHCLYLLLFLVCTSRAKRPHCPTSASNCDECIRSGPECAWCTAPASDIRCQTSKVLGRAGCPKDRVYNPQGEVQVAKNDSRYWILVHCRTFRNIVLSDFQSNRHLFFYWTLAAWSKWMQTPFSSSLRRYLYSWGQEWGGPSSSLLPGL